MAQIHYQVKYLAFSNNFIDFYFCLIGDKHIWKPIQLY